MFPHLDPFVGEIITIFQDPHAMRVLLVDDVAGLPAPDIKEAISFEGQFDKTFPPDKFPGFVLGGIGWQAIHAIATRLNACPFRSEEHTSELQSLMRISYAVFCLKKKKKI